MNPLAKLWKNVKGEITRVVEISVSLLVAGILLPIALIYISNASAYTGVNSAVVVVATVLLPVLAIIGIAMLYMKYVKGKSD